MTDAIATSAVLLVGHGAVASDTPRQLVQRFKMLESRRHATNAEPTDEERRLDETIRSWPRTPTTDPYRSGMEQIATRLRASVGRVVVAYNEFCAPSVPDAIAALAEEGVRDVTVVTTMMTPGGVHAEIEIPEMLRALETKHPEMRIRYAWPFDLDAVAALLADACRSRRSETT